MTWVVAYDIGDDDVRTRVSKVCERFGERVQESVFECRLEGARLTELRRQLPEALGSAAAGQIRVYRVCAPCDRASFGFGAIQETHGAGPCTIV